MNTKNTTILGAIASVGVIGSLIAYLSINKTVAPVNNIATPIPTSTPVPTEAVVTTPAQKKYADGSYSATGSYVSPAGAEMVDVTVTLKDGIVTDAQFTGKAVNPGSKKMQGKFSEGFEAVVEGKSIDAIALTVVNGSSLTPKGFMDALEQIKVQAS